MPAADTGSGQAPDPRVVLVTGAASGIGRATALRYARDGLRVACVDVTEDALAATVATIEADGGTALGLPGDVGLEETAQTSVAAVVETWGALDVLANVAGIGHFCPSDEETTAAWDRIVRVNLTGTFFMCREALPHLVARRGAIVNVASIAALRGNAFGAAYSASKGGVVALTRTLACEYAARGVRVNAVCPGGVLTPIMGSFVLPDDVDPQLRARIIPLTGQLLEPDEIANAIAFLSSDAMRSTTGSVLVVDGGTVAGGPEWSSVDLSDSPQEAAFRAEARAFLDRHARLAPPDLDPSEDTPWDTRLAALTAWQRLLFDEGWVAITWPTEHGGRGLGPVEQIIWNQECLRAKVPAPVGIVGIGMAGPAIIGHGRHDQQVRHLANILSGDELWCQLFSEPGAGSDLATLATRAERDGDTWVVHGQKVWSSGAHFAQWGILVARTDPTVPKHQGLTFFLVDMASPGVTVRPLRQMNGDTHFNEVFLDGVRIPDANRLGEVGEGWKVVTTTLLHERMTLGGALGVFHMEDLLDLARQHGPLSAHQRDLLARVYTADRCLELLNMRILSKLSAGEIPSAEGSIVKLAMVRTLTEAAEAAFSLLGPASVTEESRWRNLFLIAPGIRVGGGTDEMQKNMAAERVLGLPRETDESRQLPWNQVRRS